LEEHRSCGLARGYAACLVVIVIPYFKLQGNYQITDSCKIHNDPRKENRNFYSAVYSVIRFSFSKQCKDISKNMNNTSNKNISNL